MFEETSTCDIDLNKYYLSGLRVSLVEEGGLGWGWGLEGLVNASQTPSMVAYKCHHALDPSRLIFQKQAMSGATG